MKSVHRQGDTYPVPPSAPPLRRSTVGLWWFVGIAGAILAVLATILTVYAVNDAHSAASTSPVADAFDADQQAVCERLDAEPTTSTVIDIIQDAAEEGLIWDYTHEVLSGAITDICPQYVDLVYSTGVVS